MAAPLLWLAALALLAPAPASSQAIQDSRCYLMNGGAVESFFISEDTPVGSVIGTLSVNGDPREREGDISLSLQERQAAVGIAAGTKNLTLLRALDREERRGPASVYVNVRCDRRHTADPSFVIPVSVRVWDVNDNAPAWLGGVGSGVRVRLSELTAAGARVLSVPAADPDQAGPHATIHYSVLPGPGPGAEYIGFANELDSTLVLKKPLDYETLKNFTVRLRAQDQGSPPLHNDTTLSVEVLDADDQNPKFTYEHYTAVLPQDAQEGTTLETSPGPISARDQDAGINAPLQYAATGDGARFVRVHRDSGRLAATQSLLDADLPVTIVIKAVQVDNADRYALATVSVSRAAVAGVAGDTAAGVAGVAGVRFSRREYAAAVAEDAPPGTVLATLHTDHTHPPTPNRTPKPLQFYVSDRSFLEKFAINNAGELLLRRPLDYETTDSYHYQVMVTDGVTNDTASINISVLNVNEWEPRFRHPQYEFLAEAEGGAPGGGLLPVGQLDVYDGDKPDAVSLTLRGPDAYMFYVNESGHVFLVAEALRSRPHNVTSADIHLVATATDTGTPPRQTSVPVVVRLGERLRRGAAGARRGATLPAFAAALALLALLVLALLAYIYRGRKRRVKSESPATGAATAATTEKGGAGAGAGAGAVTGVGVAGGGSGSSLSVSAGASTILGSTSSLDLRHEHRESSGRQSQRFPTKSKIAPAPSPLGSPLNAALINELSQRNGQPRQPVRETLMSDHLAGRTGCAGRSGVAWPSATIPARVKKLSWDDTHAPHTHEGEGEGEGAGVTEATNAAAAEHMNLTVYF